MIRFLKTADNLKAQRLQDESVTFSVFFTVKNLMMNTRQNQKFVTPVQNFLKKRQLNGTRRFFRRGVKNF